MYVATGFTPEQEQALLDASSRQGSSLDELRAWTEKADRIRTLTTIGLVAGLVLTMMRMGDLAISWRRRPRPKNEVEDVVEEAAEAGED